MSTGENTPGAPRREVNEFTRRLREMQRVQLLEVDLFASTINLRITAIAEQVELIHLALNECEMVMNVRIFTFITEHEANLTIVAFNECITRIEIMRAEIRDEMMQFNEERAATPLRANFTVDNVLSLLASVLRTKAIMEIAMRIWTKSLNLLGLLSDTRFHEYRQTSPRISRMAYSSGRILEEVRVLSLQLDRQEILHSTSVYEAFSGSRSVTAAAQRAFNRNF